MRGVLLTTAALLGIVLMVGCSPRPEPAKPPAQQGTKARPANPELTAPVEGALLALKTMNEAGKAKDLVGAEKAFRQFREYWGRVRPALRDTDPKLEQHIEDGAVELEHEFKKPPGEFRLYELDEETVKIGRLLSQAAEYLGVPVRPELVQREPTAELPFNQAQRITVTLSDHKIEPNLIEVEQHTKVTFVVTNRGMELHEFVIGHYAMELEEVKPGESRELTLVTIDAGAFETACYYPGHYEVGMHGTLKVKPAQLKQQ